MKLIKTLTVVACAMAFLAGSAIAEEKKEKKACCEATVAAGKKCEHKCCSDAAKENKVCEKCHPKKKDDKK